MNETLILRERERERERELETERERENSFLLMISMHTHEFRHTRRILPRRGMDKGRRRRERRRRNRMRKRSWRTVHMTDAFVCMLARERASAATRVLTVYRPCGSLGLS